MSQQENATKHDNEVSGLVSRYYYRTDNDIKDDLDGTYELTKQYTLSGISELAVSDYVKLLAYIVMIDGEIGNLANIIPKKFLSVRNDILEEAKSMEKLDKNTMKVNFVKFARKCPTFGIQAFGVESDTSLFGVGQDYFYIIDREQLLVKDKIAFSKVSIKDGLIILPNDQKIQTKYALNIKELMNGYIKIKKEITKKQKIKKKKKLPKFIPEFLNMMDDSTKILMQSQENFAKQNNECSIDEINAIANLYIVISDISCRNFPEYEMNDLIKKGIEIESILKKSDNQDNL